MIRSISCMVLASILSIPAIAGQSGSNSHDAQALMLLAAKINGLIGPDVHPWHIKVTFHTLDDTGATTDSGIYEEFWASSAHYKRGFITQKFTQTDFGTAKGVLRSGQRDEAPRLIDDLHREFVDPMPMPDAIMRQAFDSFPQDVEGQQMLCVIIAGLPINPGRSWCVEPSRPILRKTSSTGEHLQVFHDHEISYGDRFVAGDLKFIRADRTALVAHVDTLEPLDSSVNINPSDDAVPLRRRINVSAGVAVGLLQKHDPPVYPSGVSISGTVVLRAVIGVDGHIAELSVVSGPQELQQATLDAVRNWTYKPFLLNNEPVEVLTQINVVFRH